MAILQVNFLSQTLKRTVPIQVVLPSDKVLSYDGHMDESKPYQFTAHSKKRNIVLSAS